MPPYLYDFFMIDLIWSSSLICCMLMLFEFAWHVLMCTATLSLLYQVRIECRAKLCWRRNYTEILELGDCCSLYKLYRLNFKKYTEKYIHTAKIPTLIRLDESRREIRPNVSYLCFQRVQYTVYQRINRCLNFFLFSWIYLHVLWV